MVASESQGDGAAIGLQKQRSLARPRASCDSADGLTCSKPAKDARLALRFLEMHPCDVIREAFQRFPDEIRTMVERTSSKAMSQNVFVLLPHMVQDELQDVLKSSPKAAELVEHEVTQLFQEQLQEVIIVSPNCHALAFRVRLQRWEYALLSAGKQFSIKELSVSDYQKLKEKLAGDDPDTNPFSQLEINMSSFNADFPRMTNARTIGQGVTFLNRQLSSFFFRLPGAMDTCAPPGKQMLLSWMTRHKVVAHHEIDDQGRPLNTSCYCLLDQDIIKDAGVLERALLQADHVLDKVPDDMPAQGVSSQLRALGFKSGWGKDVGRIRGQLRLAADIMQAPSAETLATFLSGLPFINKIVIMSPHGYFAQKNMLGLPDTGGQVVYILDQVRALEREMRQRLVDAGLPPEAARIIVVTRLIPEARGTTCNQVWEPIAECENAAILRVPFKDAKGRVLQKWISRFDVYPYLEQFTLDVEKELLERMSGVPDCVIGNYTDGNLVASLLCRRLSTMQCNIAHALEMTKYTDANLRWRSLEPQYHFSCQFLADFLSMNNADFIITSTYQEIAGKAGGHTLGQYEAFRAFTMPGLFRVTEGMSVFDPRFNIVSPGADQHVYFPYTDKEHRCTQYHDEIRDLVWGNKEEDGYAVGVLDESRKDLPVLFSMARLDKVKNLTGLAEMYANSPRLQKVANLVIVGGVLHPERTKDREERAECEKMHDALQGGLRGGSGPLRGKVRWIVAQHDRLRNGELYRVIADNRGAFIQPALFEAFGLTVIEAMTSGLPTFATNQGGPSEIIKHGVSGFQFDPYHTQDAADLIAEFFEKCQADPDHWVKISEQGLQRIASRYTWNIYAARLLDLACVYSFWRFATDLDRADTKQYLSALYTLKLRPLMQQVPRTAEAEDADGINNNGNNRNNKTNHTNNNEPAGPDAKHA